MRIKQHILNAAKRPFWRHLMLKTIERFELGSFEQRAKLGAIGAYAHYGYALYFGAKLGKRLGLKRVSAIEFGVAGGNGLLALERFVGLISDEFAIDIDVYGFDTGKGLPTPTDYRDLPFYWQGGDFAMNAGELRKRLARTELVIGDVADTVSTFFSGQDRAPLAAAFFDLDYYSSTKAALEVFKAAPHHLLPRIYCYFDDISGNDESLISHWTGQRAAIREFNESEKDMKIDTLHYMNARSWVPEQYQRLRAFHAFRHPQYESFIGPRDQQLPIQNDAV